jgi:hypothetical protein
VIRRTDVGAAAALAALGLYGLVSGIRFGLGEPTEPGPGFLPLVSGGGLLILAVIVACAEIFMPAPPPPDEEGDSPMAPDAPRRVVGYAAGIFAFALLMQPIGTLPTIVLFFLWIVRGVEHQSWRLTLALTAGATLGVWLLFVKALQVSLPMIGG